MEKTKKIIRRTVFTFLKNYHTFTSSQIILLLPFSASILFSQFLLQSSSIFLLFLVLTLSLFPLVMAKYSILKTLNPQEPTFQCQSSFPLLKIQTFNMGMLISLSAAYNSSKSLALISNHPLLMTIFAAVYYTICTNTSIIFNLAFTLSTKWSSTALAAIRDAFSMRLRESRSVLMLTLPPSLGYVAIEALFRYRIIRALGNGNYSQRTLVTIAMEGLLISYLFSIIIVLETIAWFLFIRDCESSSASVEAERLCSQVEAIKDEGYCSKVSKDLP